MMHDLPLMAVICGLGIAALYVMATDFRLRRDALFLFFLLQIVVYVYAAPLASLVIEDNWNAPHYFRLWVGTTFLYLLPMLIVYRTMMHGLGDLTGFRVEYASARAVRRFSFILLGMLVLYYVRALSLGFFFRRVGTEYAAELFAGLGYFDLVLIKFHDLVAPAVMLVALILWRSQGAPKEIKFVASAFAADMLAFALLNSRITLVSLFVLSGIAMLWTGIKLKRIARWSPLLVLLFAYLLVTLMRFRAAFAVGSVDYLQALNPFGGATGPSQVTVSEWIDRTNCLDLMTIAGPRLMFARAFEVWSNPAVTLFGPLLGSPEAMELKVAGLTTAKSYILANFTNIPQVDYPSCSLTDAYAALSMMGFLLAGIVQGAVFGLITRSLTVGGSGFRLLVTVVGAFYFMLFEQEFFTFSVGWLKVLPVLVVLGPLIPVRRFALRDMGRGALGMPQR
ncbi:hypothetical protein LMG6871_00638 [Ralstonia edaphis]|uniref:hypothetical protein n=1 Tax=Ralstonia edaphi TaxID=3058599 RepID=UPI0028F5B077|nr:hypothetical protein [Ralstonia sp. LMG 6871]CAJ0713067.1 hypothetical protein LMG6871_00638 [Ralstonia sp. LMG 6871]